MGCSCCDSSPPRMRRHYFVAYTLRNEAGELEFHNREETADWGPVESMDDVRYWEREIGENNTSASDIRVIGFQLLREEEMRGW